MASLLKMRAYENESPRQNISIFDVERNLEAREGLKEKELQRKQECDREVEDVVDYLAPYLALLGNPAEINKQQALQIRDDCLFDYRKLLSVRGDKIQKMLNLEKHNLSEKQKWFEENQHILTRTEKEAYSIYCSNKIFHIHTMEMRLQKHQAQFSIRCKKLENYLKNDSRLSILYK
ncbi:hypothetical protein J437_LFUL017893 [Ladona fulva]|uniref:Dynein regulatory complex subunit 7 C-terminal domain-containing protein n=1 Tax=Ladona fulva TaxID=123851 RepID=A0A8K0KR33_LADFU|nr:hypothetical protein J437_LFUL017893 [Ladona fulva]